MTDKGILDIIAGMQQLLDWLQNTLAVAGLILGALLVASGVLRCARGAADAIADERGAP